VVTLLLVLGLFEAFYVDDGGDGRGREEAEEVWVCFEGGQ